MITMNWEVFDVENIFFLKCKDVYDEFLISEIEDGTEYSDAMVDFGGCNVNVLMSMFEKRFC